MAWIPKKKVVVPLDLSEESIAALDTARDLVEDASGLHLIHVVPQRAALSPEVLWEAVSEETAIQHVKKRIEEQISDPRLAGHCLFVTTGNPGNEIAAYAERIGADLVVIPSHGRTGLEHLLIGSVAERVVRHAPCPVLVLRR